jgi:uncharacterized protein (TIGR03086 family)
VDVRANYRRSVERWAELVAGASGDWSAPTPCSEWNVRQLVNHLVYEDRWTKPLMEGKTIAEVGDAFEGDLLGDAPTEMAQAAAEEAIDSVEERWPRGGKVHLSYGEENLSEYIGQLLADHLIHGWDLAAATGQDRTLDPELVEAVATWFRQRERIYRSIGSIADRPESVADGTPQADLLIAFGRDPDWRPAPSTAT